MVKMKMVTDEATWYQDNCMMEFWETPEPSSRKVFSCTLGEAIKIAQKKKMLLAIQPEMQDECLFVDFTNE